jgi:hypothetical protein
MCLYIKGGKSTTFFGKQQVLPITRMAKVIKAQAYIALHRWYSITRYFKNA